MNNPQLEEQIAAATAYEELFVPALFQQWTPLVTQAAHLRPGNRVLDVACGTGVLTRSAASQVGQGEQTVGLDLTPAMLTVARRIAPAIDWQEGTADSLPFPAQSFDAVVSQFGLMFFPEREKSLREMLRVLVSGGHLAVAVWDSLNQIPAFADEVALVERMAGSDAAEALKAPFRLGEKRVLLQLAQEAGFASVDVTTHKGVAQFPSIRTMVEADLRGWLPVMGVFLEEEKIQEILAEASETLSSYTNEQGHAVFPVSAHILSGKKL